MLKLRKNDIELRRLQQEAMKVKREQAIASLEAYRIEYQRLKQEQLQLNLDQTNNVSYLTLGSRNWAFQRGKVGLRLHQW